MAKIRLKRGFTIMEVMVAFVVMAIGFMSMLYLALFVVRVNTTSRHMGTARFIAERHAEHLRSVDFRHPLLTSEKTTPDLDDLENPDHQETIVHNNIPYNILWNVAANVPHDDTKTVRIHVLWLEQGEQKHFQTTTIKGAVRR